MSKRPYINIKNIKYWIIFEFINGVGSNVSITFSSNFFSLIHERVPVYQSITFLVLILDLEDYGVKFEVLGDHS